jgi:hypothetical protein
MAADLGDVAAFVAAAVRPLSLGGAGGISE